MWPFDTPKRTQDLTPALERRLGTLEARQETIELKWTNTLDQLKRMTGRIEKRLSRASEADGGSPTPTETDLGPQGRILARRRQRGLPARP